MAAGKLIKIVPKVAKAVTAVVKTVRRKRKQKYSPNAVHNKPVMFKNSVEVSLTGNATGTTGTGYGRSFKFDDIADYTGIMALFDVYKIHSITIKFIPSWNNAGNSANTNAPMYVAYDPVSDSVPASASEMLDYSNVKRFSIFKPWSMTITPSFMQSVGVLASNEYCAVPSTRFWLTNTDTKAYGLRIWTDPIGVNSAPIGTLVYTYNVLAKFQT